MFTELLSEFYMFPIKLNESRCLLSERVGIPSWLSIILVFGVVAAQQHKGPREINWS